MGMALNPTFMAALYGTALGMALWMLFFFGRYVWMGWKDYRQRRTAAIAWCILLSGFSIWIGTVWLQRMMVSSGNGFKWSSLAPSLALGGALFVIGAMLTIKTFAPQGTGWRFAIAAVVSSFGVAVLLDWLI